MEVNEAKFSELMDKWIAENASPLDRTEELGIRANLGAELMGTRMTWKVFCKGLALLGVDEASISLKVLGQNIVIGSEFEVPFKPKD